MRRILTLPPRPDLLQLWKDFTLAYPDLLFGYNGDWNEEANTFEQTITRYKFSLQTKKKPQRTVLRRAELHLPSDQYAELWQEMVDTINA